MIIAKTIAIDGPAASGKSTIGKKLADELGYLFFDTGAMYRAVTWAALEKGVALGDDQALSDLAERIEIDVQPPTVADGRSSDVMVDGQDVTWKIRRKEVDDNVSLVSACPGVRRALTRQQRRVGLRGKVVMVGRDIGTVVLPEADLKVFLDASVEERARRRYQELSERGERTSLEEITQAMRKRDQFDSSRRIAPLRPAADAFILHTDGLNIQQVVARIKDLFFQKNLPT